MRYREADTNDGCAGLAASTCGDRFQQKWMDVARKPNSIVLRRKLIPGMSECTFRVALVWRIVVGK
jgi:hypothetical protein